MEEQAEHPAPRKHSRRRKWLIAIGVGLFAGLLLLTTAAAIIARRFDPYVREQALNYLQERFDGEVELGSLRVRVPTVAPLRLILGRGDGTLLTLDGDDLVLRHKGRRDVPPLFILKKFSASADLGSIFSDAKTVDQVMLEGMEINLPPKGQRPSMPDKNDRSESEGGTKTSVIIDEVLIRDAKLMLHSLRKPENPLRFDLHDIRLESAGKDVAMRYQAVLTNAKPRGEIHSMGTFGPWAAEEPGDTPLQGSYSFDDADLGIFNGIAGILDSTGSFEGSLSSIVARGEARVPDFRLKTAQNPVPLSTTFEVLVDGTNGNTELKPVKAILGSTHFTTSGVVVRREGEARKTISLRAKMPEGYLRDVLKLAMKGAPFMEGRLNLDTQIDIPPLTGKVKEKLLLDGTFEVTDGKFLKSTIQDQIDMLSRRGQGKPKNMEIDQVVSRMSGDFHMEDEAIRFGTMAFAIPGAAVNLAGLYDLGEDNLDFRGVLMLDARVSQTMTGWKRWVLKPVDPFFAKNGAGTYLKIKVVGTAKEPKFGLDR
jgi:hypothetical protein